MYEAYFTLDCIDETEGALTPFKGYTHGDFWNGFATPYFTKEVADRLIAALNKVYTDSPFALSVTGPDQPYAWYDEAKDAFINLYENDLSDVEQWDGFDMEVHGQTLTLYAIGHSCWTWNSYAVEDIEEPQAPTFTDKATLLGTLAAQMHRLEETMIDKPKDRQLDRDLAFLAHTYDVISDMNWIGE